MIEEFFLSSQMAVVCDTLCITASTKLSEKVRDFDAPIEFVDDRGAVTKDCGDNLADAEVTVTRLMGRCLAVLALSFFVTPRSFVFFRT